MSVQSKFMESGEVTKKEEEIISLPKSNVQSNISCHGFLLDSVYCTFFFYIISPLFYDTLILNESRKLESCTIDYPDFMKHYYQQPSPLF